MKKFLSLAFVLITILSLAVPTFAVDGDSDQKAIYEKGVLLTQSNSKGITGEPPPAYDPINDRINDEKELQLTQSVNAGNRANITRAPASAFLTCDYKMQITDYWCGIASVEQVLSAPSSGGHSMPTYSNTVYGGTYQGGMAYAYGISTTSGTEPHQLTPMLNNYSNSGFYWGYRYIPYSGNTAANDVRTRAHQTIGTDNKCCIVFTDTYYYDYYNGNQYFHWVTLRGYTPSSFFIVDPINNSNYDGAHTIDNWSFGMAIERYNSKPNLIW